MAQALWGIDATFLRAFWTSCRLLSPDQASGLGGRLLRGLGPRLRQHRKLCRNLATAFPEWSDEKVGAVAKDSWENIGRVLAEIPHMGRICGANWRTYIETGLQLNRAREMTSDRPVIFVSAHLGNWELTPAIALQLGIPLSVVYSRQQNPIIDTLLQRHREALGCRFVEKADNVHALVAELRAGSSLGLLLDQRLDAGDTVAFFGRETPVAIAPAFLDPMFAA
jgi:KDO2-lipid IV(A) lauroyltransferase